MTNLRSKNIKCEEINSKMSLNDIENIKTFTNFDTFPPFI